MDEIHTGVGSVLILLHTFRVWVFQGFGRETFYNGRSRTGSIPFGHNFAVFPGLQRWSDISNGL